MELITNYPMTDRIRSIKTFRTPKNFWLQVLIFVGVFLTANMLQSCVMIAGMIPEMLAWAAEKTDETGMEISSEEVMEFVTNMTTDPSMMQLMLFSTAIVTITCLLFCRVIEGRKAHTIGFYKKGAFLQYLLGLVVGFAMFSSVVGLSYIVGGLTANGFTGVDASALILAFVGFGIQGMSEEVLCRGYFMTSILRHHKPWVAIVSNSVIFAILHGANPGISPLALINLTLCGIMFSLYVLRTDNLWGACALHSIWNFVQGNFFGLPVSGMNSGDSIFSFSLNEGQSLINGGAFGAEAGIPTTIVLTLVILILLYVPFGKKQEDDAA